jgi:hypothetical protein
MAVEGDRIDAAALARALDNPLRARLFLEYLRDPTSPSRAARKLRAPLNLVAYHTNALAKAGCLRRSRVERRRGATERFFEAVFLPVLENDEWAALPPRLRRGLCRETLHVITQDALRGVVHGGFDRARNHMSMTPVHVDEEGADAIAALLRKLIDDVELVQRESVERGAEGAPMELSVLFFESLNPSVRG